MLRSMPSHPVTRRNTLNHDSTTSLHLITAFRLTVLAVIISADSASEYNARYLRCVRDSTTLINTCLLIIILNADWQSHIPAYADSHGRQNGSAISFVKELGHRISQCSGDDCETQFLFQQLSVIMLRYNAVLYGERFSAASDDLDT